MFTVQWQAEETLHARPASYDSKAPRLVSGGASWMPPIPVDQLAGRPRMNA